MRYNVKSIEVFEKQAKRLIKKYPSLKAELLDLVNKLKDNAVQGVLIGKNCYKIRLSIASKGKGKSGGARIITNLTVSGHTIYLLSIYDKADKDNLSDSELKILLSNIPE